MTVDAFAHSIAHLSPSLNKVSKQKNIFVRYEDLTVDCLGILNNIFNFLGVDTLSSTDELLKNSGSYASYVGNAKTLSAILIISLLLMHMNERYWRIYAVLPKSFGYK